MGAINTQGPFRYNSALFQAPFVQLKTLEDPIERAQVPGKLGSSYLLPTLLLTAEPYHGTFNIFPLQRSSADERTIQLPQQLHLSGL